MWLPSLLSPVRGRDLALGFCSPQRGQVLKSRRGGGGLGAENTGGGGSEITPCHSVQLRPG